MHILLFLMIAALFLEQLGKLFLYEKFDFVINIFGNFIGSFFYLSGILAICLSIIILYKKIKAKEIKLQNWDIMFALVMLWGLISVILSEDKHLTIMGTFYRMDGYLAYLIYTAMYIGCRTLKSDKMRLWIIRAFSFVMTSLCFEYLFTENNLSIFNNRNHFAYVLTLSCMLLAGLFIFETKFIFRILYLTMYSLNIYTMIYADTFGSYLGIMFALIFTVIFIVSTKKKLLVPALITLIFFIVISAYVDSKTGIVTTNFKFFSFDINKVATGSPNADAAGSGRIKLWKQSFEYMKDKPLFGYGPEGTFYKFIEEDKLLNDRPHNEYIQHALFMGIPAAIFYITGLILILVYAIKNRKRLPDYTFISGITVFAYCISAFFGNTMYYTSPYFFMMLGMVSKPLETKK